MFVPVCSEVIFFRRSFMKKLLKLPLRIAALPLIALPLIALLLAF